MLCAFPSCLFLWFPTILYCFFPALFLCFIICSKQVVEAVVSENVKLRRSNTIQVFSAWCSLVCSLLLITSDCSRAASGVCWTLPSLCPRNAAFECSLWFWVTVTPGTTPSAAFPEFSNALGAASSAGDTEMAPVWSEAHFQVITNTVSVSAAVKERLEYYLCRFLTGVFSGLCSECWHCKML